ncbi:AEC family transporter [Morganella morganii]|uniref:AEC family transporter n=1 Tax=Morganella morganii TaxID=582 RepID=UPI0021D2B67C|nr:AEC family transporter [Morganella morganii]MCU6211543.1 AEC family transporter [Morganella morganii]
MFAILMTLWPLFALILLGCILKRRPVFDAGFWNGAEKLNYYILFPALLINSLAVAPLDNPQLPKLAAALVIMLGLSTAAFAVVKRLRGIPTAEFGVLLQGAIRFNTYLGLSIVNDFYGPSGVAVAAVILAVLVPLCNIISVVALSEFQQLSLRRLLLPILTNPLIISCIIGMFLNVTGTGLPYNTDQFAGLLAGASLPLGLLCVGAALQVATIRYSALKISLNSLVRLCVMPLLAIAVATVMGLTQLEYQLFVIFFAIPTAPTAPTAYILSRQLGGDSQLMAGIITFQTMVAILTLPVVLTMIT